MRRVRGPETQVQVERPIGVDLLAIGDELDRPVDQIRAEVITLLRRRRRLDLVVVIHEVGVPLARVAAEESVETLKTARQRPTVIRPGGRLVVARRQMPLADHKGVVSVAEQHLRQESVLERDDPVVTGIPRSELGDRGHAIAVVVAAGQNARPARRAQRRRVHVVVAQPVRRKRIEVGRLDRAAVTAQLPESGVVKDDHQYVRRARHGPSRLRPRRRRHIRRPTNNPRERSSRLVLGQRHADPRSGFPQAHGMTATAGSSRRMISGDLCGIVARCG